MKGSLDVELGLMRKEEALVSPSWDDAMQDAQMAGCIALKDPAYSYFIVVSKGERVRFDC